MEEKNSINAVSNNMHGITGTGLKTIAALTMLMDHVGFAIVRRLPDMTDTASATYKAYASMRLIGRLAFPLYIFLLVEGLAHTRSRLKYVIRMAIFALMSEVPFDLAFYGKLTRDHQNVFLTLTIGLVMLCGFEYMSKKGRDVINPKLMQVITLIVPCAGFTCFVTSFLPSRLSYQVPKPVLAVTCAVIAELLILACVHSYAGNDPGKRVTLGADLCLLAVGMAAGVLLKVDYRYSGVAAIAMAYYCRPDSIRGMLGSCAVLTALSGATEIFAVLDAPLISLYNGRRGPGLKYFFYACYPVHLTLLYFIAKRLGLL